MEENDLNSVHMWRLEGELPQRILPQFSTLI